MNLVTAFDIGQKVYTEMDGIRAVGLIHTVTYFHDTRKDEGPKITYGLLAKYPSGIKNPKFYEREDLRNEAELIEFNKPDVQSTDGKNTEAGDAGTRPDKDSDSAERVGSRPKVDPKDIV